jgi:hypothetical protein
MLRPAFIGASWLEVQMNRQMNQMSGRQGPSFTPKQGQYLAFIDA